MKTSLHLQIANLETKRLTLTEHELPKAKADMQAKVSKAAELNIQIRSTEVILHQLQVNKLMMTKDTTTQAFPVKARQLRKKQHTFKILAFKIKIYLT